MVVIKWSKALQDRAKVATVSSPALGLSLLCPWTAIENMLLFAFFILMPLLFQPPHLKRAVPPTDSGTMKHLKDISKYLGFSRSITFQDFRRGGAILTLDMGFLCRTYRPRGRGALPVSGDIYSSIHLHPLLLLIPSLLTCLLSYLYWVPGDLYFFIALSCSLGICARTHVICLCH